MSQTISTRTSPPPLILRPARGLGTLNLADLWKYRELVYFLTWRDLKVRYKQTVLGAAWAIIQPVMQMVVFTLLFGGLANLASDNVPYPIFNYTALLPWGLFSKALTDAGRSLVANRNMITKVYFPRLVIPIASVFGGMVDFLIAFLVLLAMMVYYNVVPTAAVWTLPLFLLLALVTALGVSLWLSALNVIYRDVGYVLPFLAQIWFFLTPIVYSSTEVLERWQLEGFWRSLYYLNPMVGVVDGFRWALLGSGAPPGPMLLVSTGVSFIILVTGLYYFRHMERSFADEI